MNEPWKGWAQERALWQLWSATEQGAARPDALTLAAFAEDRLTGAARAEIEALLAADPELAEDVAAARQAVVPRADETGSRDETALAAITARAAALVPGGAGGNVLSFRPAHRAVPAWPSAARWGAIAASLALVSWLGFALGSNAYVNLAALDGQSASSRLADELLDPPSGFFGLVDTSGT
jgi:anti-sigma factor RsiW